MIETIVISVLSVLVVALAFTTINLLRKNEIFKSDDEIGFMYEQIKDLQKILSNFRIDKL
jgi:hypothetical protein